VLAGWRPRRRPVRRDWFRLADRLAAGMAPQAAVLPEGADTAVVKELLAREDFRTRVEASREALAEPPEAARKRLVILARQTLERALIWDDDAKAALFVLEEDAHGRDAAMTLAESVLSSRDQALAARPPTPPPAEPRLAQPHLGHAPATTLCAPRCTAAPPSCATPSAPRTPSATPRKRRSSA
jgi:hypothetical protein